MKTSKAKNRPPKKEQEKKSECGSEPSDNLKKMFKSVKKILDDNKYFKEITFNHENRLK